MFEGTWPLKIVGFATVVGALVVAALVLGQGDSPEVRSVVSADGLDVDAAETTVEDSGEAGGEVAIYEGVDQLREAFIADEGHPRLILLVDPI